ncbi:hypothetical protein FVE85_9288 [Porphyridium purpureum]|uniref:Origin recognition complex subunit 3 winged helix C-terminal domain-containing protein n=1 Tax=Porphyridium purpureum TaxID=35688 RepID=A0A5J4YNX7_PORPP|nr:hypothetical protein FVE85_9288 [Porphyridium purpureum]|eukprot:POR0857..scf222_8
MNPARPGAESGPEGVQVARAAYNVKAVAMKPRESQSRHAAAKRDTAFVSQASLLAEENKSGLVTRQEVREVKIVIEQALVQVIRPHVEQVCAFLSSPTGGREHRLGRDELAISWGDDSDTLSLPPPALKCAVVALDASMSMVNELFLDQVRQQLASSETCREGLHEKSWVLVKLDRRHSQSAASACQEIERAQKARGSACKATIVVIEQLASFDNDVLSDLVYFCSQKQRFPTNVASRRSRDSATISLLALTGVHVHKLHSALRVRDVARVQIEAFPVCLDLDVTSQVASSLLGAQRLTDECVLEQENGPCFIPASGVWSMLALERDGKHAVGDTLFSVLASAARLHFASRAHGCFIGDLVRDLDVQTWCRSLRNPECWKDTWLEMKVCALGRDVQDVLFQLIAERVPISAEGQGAPRGILAAMHALGSWLLVLPLFRNVLAVFCEAVEGRDVRLWEFEHLVIDSRFDTGAFPKLIEHWFRKLEERSSLEQLTKVTGFWALHVEMWMRKCSDLRDAQQNGTINVEYIEAIADIQARTIQLSLEVSASYESVSSGKDSDVGTLQQASAHLAPASHIQPFVRGSRGAHAAKKRRREALLAPAAGGGEAVGAAALALDASERSKGPLQVFRSKCSKLLREFFALIPCSYTVPLSELLVFRNLDALRASCSGLHPSIPSAHIVQVLKDDSFAPDALAAQAVLQDLRLVFEALDQAPLYLHMNDWFDAFYNSLVVASYAGHREAREHSEHAEESGAADVHSTLTSCVSFTDAVARFKCAVTALEHMGLCIKAPRRAQHVQRTMFSHSAGTV